jgi:hypothetical protein
MAQQSGDNEQRLREANLIKSGPLPDEYAAVVKDLAPEHVDALIAVRKRLDEVEAGDGPSADECMFPP